MSDAMVSQEVVTFFHKAFLSALEEQSKTKNSFNVLQNAAAYISLLLTRMNMDEQHDFTYNNQPAEFRPTLNYHLDAVFQSFCKIVFNLVKAWEYKEVVGPFFGIAPIKVVEPLTLMTRHSRFPELYQKISKAERSLGLQALLVLMGLYSDCCAQSTSVESCSRVFRCCSRKCSSRRKTSRRPRPKSLVPMPFTSPFLSTSAPSEAASLFCLRRPETNEIATKKAYTKEKYCCCWTTTSRTNPS
jgi:hypothetical protein